MGECEVNMDEYDKMMAENGFSPSGRFQWINGNLWILRGHMVMRGPSKTDLMTFAQICGGLW